MDTWWCDLSTSLDMGTKMLLNMKQQYSIESKDQKPDLSEAVIGEVQNSEDTADDEVSAEEAKTVTKTPPSDLKVAVEEEKKVET